MSTVRIAVDLLGGDHGPAVVVDGALQACRADPGMQLLLVGPASVADGFLRALDPDLRERVGARTGPATAAPALGSGRGLDTTVRAAVRAVADGSADAVLSAGPTGATVSAAALGLGRWPGVRRPVLAATVPTAAGLAVLLDVGASVDATPATLAGHAILGAAYASVALGERPRVGLLSIGHETGKGDRVRRATDPLLHELALPAGARYAGLVEGDDVVAGDRADVVVTDGFTGNVLLKGLEAAFDLTGARPAGAPPRAAALLGVAGVAVVCHGAAARAHIASGLALAAHLHRTASVATLTDLITAPGIEMPDNSRGDA
ncbi:glycerol-3-phosphate acyltransferase PlsX [Spirilliplanes yamanashiensis]|nr:glycerol-3-phosphate acyltransferase PlsX [Spirilliplanes yamanashiensis]